MSSAAFPVVSEPEEVLAEELVDVLAEELLSADSDVLDESAELEALFAALPEEEVLSPPHPAKQAAAITAVNIRAIVFFFILFPPNDLQACAKLLFLLFACFFVCKDCIKLIFILQSNLHIVQNRKCRRLLWLLLLNGSTTILYRKTVST